MTVLAIASADGGTLIPVPQVRGSVGTQVFGINDNNVVVGSYFTSDNVEHGFFGTLDGQYTTFDIGSGLNTEPRGINNTGVVMGITYPSGGSTLPWEMQPNFATSYITLKHGAPMGQGTDGGINADGVFAASGYDQNLQKFYGFVGKKAHMTKALSVPGAAQTRPRGIDDAGDVVGFYYNDQGPPHGFLMQGGVATTIDYPTAVNGTYLYGINSSGVMVGFWSDANNTPYPFVYDPSSGKFIPLAEKNVDGGKIGQAFGVNNAGFVAVNFFAADGPFIYCPKKPSKCPSSAAARRGHSVRIARP